MIGKILQRQGELGLDLAGAGGADDGAADDGARRRLDHNAVLGGVGRNFEHHRQRPGRRRQHDPRAAQQTARPAGNVDAAGRPHPGPVAGKKQLGRPGDRPQRAARRISEIGAEGAARDRPLAGIEPIPPPRRIAGIGDRDARLDGTNQFGDLAAVDTELQVLGDCRG